MGSIRVFVVVFWGGADGGGVVVVVNRWVPVACGLTSVATWQVHGLWCMHSMPTM
jgi:hypothetical protein